MHAADPSAWDWTGPRGAKDLELVGAAQAVRAVAPKYSLVMTRGTGLIPHICAPPSVSGAQMHRGQHFLKLLFLYITNPNDPTKKTTSTDR